MRIGLIKHQFVRLGGGSERYTSGLVSALLQAGHTVRVFARVWDDSAQIPGIEIRPVPAFGITAFARQLTFALACRKAVERAPCDLVFSLERTLKQDICRAGGGCHREWLIQRRRYLGPGKRWMLALNPLHRTLLWLEQRTFSPAHTRAIIANSHRGKQEILRHYRFPAGQLFVVHNGVDTERFQPCPRNGRRSEVVLLFAGSGFERKGLEFCVRVLTQLPAEVQLQIAGKGNRAPYQRLARSLGVDGRIRFVGAIANIEEIYATADLLLHPAIYEPFSNACLEAMACGLPVVTSRFNGAAEVITPGHNGAVVDEPADIPALARAIEPFLDPGARAAASASARQAALKLPFSLNARQTLEIIEHCARPLSL